MEVKISVIVPMYNSERYLRECLESITNQTYTNLEIILIDDGSNDSTLEICNEYKKIDKRINIIHQENLGVSSARNKGLEVASGKYISFVDSDDFIELDMIEKMVLSIKSTKSTMCVCGYNIYSNVKGIKRKSLGKNMVFSNIDMLNSILNSNKINGFLCNKMFDRNMFENLRLPEDINLCEDLYVLCVLLKKEQKIPYIAKELYNYRDNNQSITNSVSNIFDLNGESRYLKAYEKIAILFEEDKKVLNWIKSKVIKTLLENYYLLVKSKIKNNVINEKIYNRLYASRKFYLSNIEVSFKMKLIFLFFYSSLKIKVFLAEFNIKAKSNLDYRK